MKRREVFWHAIGGRKMFNGYLYAVLITVVASRVDPFPFEPYAMWLAAALLGTSAIVAIEDRKARPFPSRRATDQPAREPAPDFEPHQWADGEPHEGIL